MAVSPVYSIHRYTDEIYKVVAFKGHRDPDFACLREEAQHYDTKLDNSFSRARSMVLQYALCNPWDYFFTGTLDQRLADRYNLDRYAKRLMQFIRDKRKKYNASFQVLLVPELHQDGAWHIHGLIYGLPASALRPFRYPEPQKLIDGGFLNWPDYQRAFGFCSLAPIRDRVATAYYVTKYISKDVARRAGDVGKHLYFHSRPLKRAEKASDVYIYHRQLEECCTQDYDFCKVGMVQDAKWYFPYIWDGAEYEELPLNPIPLTPCETFDPSTIDPYYEQIKMDGYR